MSSDWLVSIFFLVIGLWLAGGLFSLITQRKPTLSHSLGAISALLASSTLLVMALIAISSGLEVQLSRAGLFLLASFSWHLDPVGGFFLLLIGLGGTLASWYGLGYCQEYPEHKPIGILWFCFNLFLASLALVVTAGNGLLFLLSWEMMSLFSYFLVVFEYDRQNVRKAGYVYLVMTHIGTAFITAAFLLFYKTSGSWEFTHWSQAQLSPGLLTLVFLFGLVGFGTKAGLVPLHIWLPRAHPVAPSHMSALMSGVMVKLAVYGFYRLAWEWLPARPPLFLSLLVLSLGAVSALLAMLFALSCRDLKQLLAFSTIENVGIIFLALGTALTARSLGQAQLAELALGAALLHTLNHTVMKSLAFFGAGAVLYRTHTKNLDELGGLAKLMPWTGVTFFLAVAALSALPPLNGFYGEWQIYRALLQLNSALQPQGAIAVFATLGAVALAFTGALALAALSKAYAGAFLATPRSEKAAHAGEVPASMRLPMALAALLLLVLGLSGPQVYHWLLGQVLAVNSPVPAGSLLLVSGQLLLLGLLLFLGLRILNNLPVRQAPTWGCGIELTPRMEYSASGITMPLAFLFRRWTFAARVEDYLYRPLWDKVMVIVGQLRSVQTGRLQTYLAYMLITLVILLIWVS